MRVLVLGGTTEASRLAALLAAARRDIWSMLSFAGRTKAPIAPAIPYRIGGFGGVEGLVSYLERERIELLVDATHPYAEQMSRNAELASAQAGIPLIVLTRPPWLREPGDDWTIVGDMEAAAAALGPEPKRVFLTIGRLQLAAFASAPQHAYLIRAVDPFDPPPELARCRVIAGRGPFGSAAEEELLRDEKIEMIVTKNSGGGAAFAKIVAARRLGLPVVMVERPQGVAGDALHDPAEAMAHILAHAEALASRGV